MAATAAYYKQFKKDLEAINPELYFEPEATLQSVKEQFDGTPFDARDIQNIADGNYADVFRRAEGWIELPSGAGFVWSPS